MDRDMDGNEERTLGAELCRQLGITDRSLLFLLILIGSVLLSFWATCIGRDALCRTIQGGQSAPPDLYPLRKRASAMAVGGLGFFLCLAIDTDRRAQAGGNPVAARSARTNLWAAVLVLAAAVLRLEDLDFLRQCGGNAQVDADIQPD